MKRSNAKKPNLGPTKVLSRRDLLVGGAAVSLTLPLGLGACDDSLGPLDLGADAGADAAADLVGSDLPATDTAGDMNDALLSDAPLPGDLGHDLPPTTVFFPETITEDKATFPLGVQAGAMTGPTALVWGHAADNKTKLLRVWRDAAPGKVWLDVEMQVNPKDGYFSVPLSGLIAGARYRYAFFVGSGTALTARSAIGKFRSALAAGSTEAVTVAATHGTNALYMPYKGVETMAQYSYDVFCQLGDMTYNDGASTLSQYRGKWQKTLKDPGYRALLTKAGAYYTWDDHEFINDDKLYSLAPSVLKAAKDAFFETLPVERQANDRLWKSYRWGKSVEFFVLDCRLERQPKTRGTSDPIYISKAQMAWLKQGLKSSPCHFKVLLNSVPITKMPPLWLAQKDRWQGYGKQRDELLDYITNNSIKNVWFISGDFHVGSVGRVETTGARSKIWEVLAGPGGNGPNPLWLLALGGPIIREQIFPAKQFPHFSGVFAATLMTFDPAKDAVHIRFIDQSHKILYDGWINSST